MAKVLRFSELTPETYSEQSRDYLLFCALIDSQLNGCKFEIDSMKYLNVPEYCPSQYLTFLAHKLGFYYQSTIYEDELRKILSSFKLIVMYKGSLQGINQAIRLFMNIKQAYFNYTIDIDTVNGYIYISVKDKVVTGLEVLTDILKYVIPCGYLFKYRFLKTITIGDKAEDAFSSTQSISGVIINTPANTLRTVQNSPDSGDYQPMDDVETPHDDSPIINAFNTQMVVAQAVIVAAKDNDKTDAVLVNFEEENTTPNNE